MITNFANAASIPALVQSIHHPNCIAKNIELSILRLDKIHPIISGNKLFKLHGHIQRLQQQSYQGAASFGGAYSNHLAALAYACNVLHIDSIGIIRGEQPTTLSPTLLDCIRYGMQLKFVSRSDYAQQDNIKAKYPNHYWIDMGGYGTDGTTGFKWLLNRFNSAAYSHIITAVGSGTTVAALQTHCTPQQQIIGISSMKQNHSLQNSINALLPDSLKNRYQLFHDYHFGGFAKTTTELIEFIQTIYRSYQLPTDIVYTSKMIYGTLHLIRNNHFRAGDKILMIHGGGLQGNRSLPPETLPF